MATEICHSSRVFCFRGRRLVFEPGRPLIAGILNCTPDSFSDGGSFMSVDSAASHAESMLEQGADIIDIGGESTRPGFSPVSAEEQLRRILPVIAQMRRRFPKAVLSVDTTLAYVAKVALDEGADIINDVSMVADDGMPEVVARANAGYVLTHNAVVTGQYSNANDVAESVAKALADKRDVLMELSGLPSENILLDPGIGFAKNDDESMKILSRLERIYREGALCLGVSRKSFIGRIAGEDKPADRLGGSLAVALSCRNKCNVLRVHDVAAHRQALILAEKLEFADSE